MEEAYSKQKQRVKREIRNQWRARRIQGTMRTVWLEQWFSTQTVATPARVSEICGGGFDHHMIGGTGLQFGRQKLIMLAVL